MTRLLLLAVSAATIGAMASPGAAAAQEYPYCSSEGVGVGQSCTYETAAQCEAAVRGLGIYCYKNPRYTAPAVIAPAPQPAPAAPSPQKRRTAPPSATKS
jgi:hypothetical protein